MELFREQYIENKVEDWGKDLQLLLNYAKDDLQCSAYSAFTKGLCSRWTHFLRTVLDCADMSELFKPLENIIRD